MSQTEPEPTLWDELTSPVNFTLILVIAYLIYKIVRAKFEPEPVPVTVQRLPKMRKDLTVQELRKYNGTQPDGRVLLAVNGVIFDVTRGKSFYGPGGPYAAFAGTDATRGLATGTVAGSDKDYDDVSDLTPDEVSAAKEWEEQFTGKYDIVGRLLKPGETAKQYSDDESEAKTEDKKSQ
ncbi:membrane-associated progesterone receptor component 1-like [Leguminivora glycinivorella]|uniref:membrane-associated progesterone receptor component 1-like n=1 Tax=Leguminivora glycinivorella TaxID=1035111 RepID=UPI00200CB68C|nr:membrane-associated progesterone receptor component 1-like [Leguminivora glycinivorella]